MPLEALNHNGFDALLPKEMAEKAEHVGIEKTRFDFVTLLALAILAGAFVAFGSQFALVTTAGTDGVLPYGLVRLLSGIVFSLGLILIIVGGAELFTGNNLMVMACASRRVTATELLRAWGIVYVGNFVGSVVIALLVFLADGYRHGGGAVGAVTLASAEAKAAYTGFQALIHGVLANILVCLATWLCFSARSTVDKIFAIAPPIAAFVSAGFEHSIANMYLFSFALFTKNGATPDFWTTMGKMPADYPHLTMLLALKNLMWVTIGNMIGGVAVGATYWFIYLRKRGVGQ